MCLLEVCQFYPVDRSATMAQKLGDEALTQKHCGFHSWVLSLFVGPLIKFLPIPNPTLEASQAIVLMCRVLATRYGKLIVSSILSLNEHLLSAYYMLSPVSMLKLDN